MKVRLVVLLAALMVPAPQAFANTPINLGDHFLPIGVNAHQQVVGDIEDLNDESSTAQHPHAGLWQSGAVTPLAEPSTVQESEAGAISDSGKIAGLVFDHSGHVSALTWNASAPTVFSESGPFFDDPANGDYTTAADIDEAGDFVGLTPDGTTDYYQTGYVHRASGATVRVGAGDRGAHGSTSAAAITPDGATILGHVSATSIDTWYLWSGSAPSASGTALDITPEFSGVFILGGSIYASDRQNSLASDGSVIGYKGTGDTRTNWLRTPNGSETPLTGLAGVNAVNADHAVVGTVLAGPDHNEIHAAVWRNGTVTDLNDAIPASSGLVLVDALAINDDGDIVGIGGDAHTGNEVGFLLPAKDLRPSASTVKCTPSASGYACSATVKDAGTDGDVKTPSGTVDFTASVGAFSAPACTLVTTTAGTASCAVSYTAPAQGASSQLKVTAGYEGDDVFATSSGDQTLCSAEAPIRLDSVAPDGRHDFGFQILSKAVLHGCGFAAGQTVRWGNDQAKVTLTDADVPGDGTTANVQVPEHATSGDVSVTDGDVTATVRDQVVDSFRNTMGFAFHNFDAVPRARVIQRAFATRVTRTVHKATGDDVLLTPYWHDWVARIAHGFSTPAGRCYGLAFMSASFADGTLSWNVFGENVAKPFDFHIDGTDGPASASLRDAADTDYWKQFSDEDRVYRLATLNQNSGADIRAALAAAFGPNGFSHPAIISIDWKTGPAGHQQMHGHSVAGFAVEDNVSEDDPGAFRILVADSNAPYRAEDDDAANHVKRQQLSSILVHGDGKWEDSAYPNARGGPADLEVTPIAAVSGALHITRDDELGLAPGTQVETYSESGKTIDLSGTPPAGLIVRATSDATDPGLPAAAATNGMGGISSIEGAKGPTAVTIGGAGTIGATFLGKTTTADVSGGAGHLALGFQPTTNAITVASAKGEAAPKTVTVHLLEQVGGATQMLTATGPAGITASLQGGVATVKATHAVHIYVSTVAADGTPQTYDAGRKKSVSLPAKRWRHLKKFKGPAAKVVKLTRKALTVKLPKLVATDASVDYAIGKLKGSVPLTGKRTVTVPVKVKKGKRKVTLTTETTGSLPTRVTRTRRIRVTS